MSKGRVFTIGFTQTTAKSFFERLQAAGVRQVVDVRLHNTSQLAGFAKSDDLAFFLERIGGIGYRHEPLLAPTDEILKGYRKGETAWDRYEAQFRQLMQERRIETRLDRAQLDGACLLCSEAEPHHCHRRVVCDYLNTHWDGALQVRHL